VEQLTVLSFISQANKRQDPDVITDSSGRRNTTKPTSTPFPLLAYLLLLSRKNQQANQNPKGDQDEEIQMCTVAFCIHHTPALMSVGGGNLLERRAVTECSLGLLHRHEREHEDKRPHGSFEINNRKDFR
jgi:hypothetical protein